MEKNATLFLHSANMITPKMIIIKSIVIVTITAVISLQQTGFAGCLIREPPYPLTIVKCVELAFEAASFSFVLLFVDVTIESTVIVISRFDDGFVLAGASLCSSFKRAKLAAVKFARENVLYGVSNMESTE